MDEIYVGTSRDGMGKVLRYSCDCGCGDGFEMRNAYGHLYVSFFRGDWAAQQMPVRTSIRDRLEYMAGERFLREVMMTSGAVAGVRDFLSSVNLYPVDIDGRPPMSRLGFECEDLGGGCLACRAMLDGRMPGQGVLLGWYHKMFEIDARPKDVARWIRELDGILSVYGRGARSPEHMV